MQTWLELCQGMVHGFLVLRSLENARFTQNEPVTLDQQVAVPLHIRGEGILSSMCVPCAQEITSLFAKKGTLTNCIFGI